MSYVNKMKILLACLTLAVLCADNNASVYAASDAHDPYVQNVTTSSIVVMWQTVVDADSEVEYGLTTSYGNSVYNAELVTNHEMLLSGLAAGTVYHYRTIHDDGSGPVYSADSTFKAAPSTTVPFVFAIHTDSQNYGDIYAQICNATLALNPLPDITMHCGDITATNSYGEWTEIYFTPAAPLISKIAMYGTQGITTNETAVSFANISTCQMEVAVKRTKSGTLTITAMPTLSI
jgi:hypothetical protein